MQSLVIKHNNHLVTALQKVAEETSSDITSMQRLIRTHRERLERFGAIEFKEIQVKGKTGSTKKKHYYLNEQQSYLFITFLKNTKAVLDFKEMLIKEFFEMKQKLNQKTDTTQLQETILQQNAIIADLQKQLPDANTQHEDIADLQKNFKIIIQEHFELENANAKLRRDNANLQRALISFSDRYHSIVIEADNKVEAIRGELEKMTNRFQLLPNLKNDGKNLNTDTKAGHSYW